MSSIEKYSFIKVNEQIEPGVFEKKYYCKDPQGLPFIVGNEFMSKINGGLRVEQTAINYLSDTLLLLTCFIHQTPVVSYLSPTKELQKEIRKIIQDDFGWHVRDNRYGNLIIEHPEFDKNTGVDLSTIKIKTLQNRIISWKVFYDFLIDEKYYQYLNPFSWTINKTKGTNTYTPMMPPRSGMTLPQKRRHWETNTYFCIKETEWELKFIDDPSLDSIILSNAQGKGVHLAIRIILRILFEGGPRIHEVVTITIGDWRSIKGSNIGAKGINKGDRNARVKIIHWNVITERMIHNYINHERMEFDTFHRSLDELPDKEPLFINKFGRPITCNGFYKHFRAICKRANVALTVHQIRHWFVTSRLRHIYELVEPSRIGAYKTKFQKYMCWKSAETMKIYDHYLGRVSDEELFDVFDREYSPKTSHINQEKGISNLTPEAIARNLEFQKFLDQSFDE